MIAEFFSTLERLESLITEIGNPETLDGAVAMGRLSKAIAEAKQELEADYDAHIDAQAEQYYLMIDAKADAVSAGWGWD
jgi:hypothetical protein